MDGNRDDVPAKLPEAWSWDTGQDARLAELERVLAALADVFDWTDGHLIEPIEEFTRPDA